jgi:hypothetical protein
MQNGCPVEEQPLLVSARRLAVTAAVGSATTAAVEAAAATAVETASSAAVEAAAVASTAVEAAARIATGLRDSAEAAAVAYATAIATVAVSATIAVASVSAAVAVTISATVAIAATEPGAGADEEAAVEPLRAVVAIGSAGVGGVVVVAVLAGGRAVAESYDDLSLGLGCGRDGESNCCEKSKIAKITHGVAPVWTRLQDAVPTAMGGYSCRPVVRTQVGRRCCSGVNAGPKLLWRKGLYGVGARMGWERPILTV